MFPPRCSWAPATGSTNLLFFFSATPRRLVAPRRRARACARVRARARRRRRPPTPSASPLDDDDTPRSLNLSPDSRAPTLDSFRSFVRVRACVLPLLAFLLLCPEPLLPFRAPPRQSKRSPLRVYGESRAGEVQAIE